jgi:acetyl-CoA carboxylase carboxyl transferase subunit beta
MIKNVFSKTKYASINLNAKNKEGIVTRASDQVNCPGCHKPVPEHELINNQKVCPVCQYHFPLSGWERISLTVDEDSFQEFDNHLSSYNVLNFSDYSEKLELAKKQSGLEEAIICGYAQIQSHPVVLAIMDNQFMMASMGSVVGEKFCRAAEKAMLSEYPFIVFCTSGGARMQEGMFSLMQMAKTSATLARLHQKGLLYISILTHPTTGGVTASFASLADIIIAEPGALIGFTGPRVIEQTLRQKLPDDFQRSEYLLEHGMLDLVISRADLKNTLANILKIHSRRNNAEKAI